MTLTLVFGVFAFADRVFGITLILLGFKLRNILNEALKPKSD